jgi:type II secretory pathway pseudopilin PulG
LNNKEFSNNVPGLVGAMLKNFSQEAGIGLAETLVALGILGVTAVTFMTALSAGTISVSNAEQQTTGQELARTQIETIKAAAYDASGKSYTTIAAPDGYHLNIDTSSRIYDSDSIQRIIVEVTYHDQQVIKLESFKVNR